MKYRACAIALGLSLVWVGACSNAPTPADVGTDAWRSCSVSSDCDDRLFCTGVESCVAGHCMAGVSPCRGSQTCDEEAARCFTTCSIDEDADGDGARARECGGTDCDDADPERFPGHTEVCDVEMHDEDCDPSTYGFRDEDGDGSPDARCCNVDPVTGEMQCGRDCDDTAPGTSPNVPEVCNGIDDDCDTAIDEGLVVHVTIDADHDGHGDATAGAASMDTCMVTTGWSLLADDCDDANAARHPGLPDVCDVDMVDEDCTGVGNDVPGGCTCVGTMTDVCGTDGLCAGATRSCMSGTWGTCAHVPQTEVCDAANADEDCDGMVDEGLTVTCYRDNDFDGYAADAAGGLPTCRSSAPDRQSGPWNGCPTGFTSRAPTAGSDCCDSDARAHPGATAWLTTARTCGGFDFDCDGSVTFEHPMRATTCSDSNGCHATSTTDGWCGAIPATCGATGGSWGAGCWNGGAGCFPTTCTPTQARCR